MRTNEKAWGVFCELMGATPRNRVLEVFLEGREVDNGIGNTAEEAQLNRATAYNVTKNLVEEGVVIPTRVVGKTQLYGLNLNNPKVKALIKVFDFGLRVVAKEVGKKYAKEIVLN